MDSHEFYTGPEWAALRERVRERDGSRCTVGWLLGGPCHDRLDVHHIIPRDERPDLELREDNCVSICARHHPMLEALRRHLLSRREPRRCPHRHTNRAGREACERRLNELVA